MTRDLLKSIARLLIGALLFGQIAVAAYACPRLLPTAKSTSLGIHATDDARAGTAMQGCGQPMESIDLSAPNLCAEHCKQGQQSDRAPTLTVPPMTLALLYSAPTVPAAAPPPRPAATSLSALAAASPPHAIAHCVLRI